jgi:molybdenum cofactor biosynthesis enzyme MoaA
MLSNHLKFLEKLLNKMRGTFIENFFLLFQKPELKYLELHLTDHCNLNCKGCGHYSPIAQENFASFVEFKKDMLRLGHLFRNIQIIRLMGGEPLLHPDVAFFLLKTRAYSGPNRTVIPL